MLKAANSAQNSSTSLPAEKMQRYRKKVVIVGDGMCGKTCLLWVQSGEPFNPEYVPTIFDNFITSVDINPKTRVELSLWDTAGQEDYDRMRPLSYPDTDVVIMAFSVADWDTAYNIEQRWLPEIKHFLFHTPIVLVACKADLRQDPHYKVHGGGKECYSYEQGAALAKKIGAIKYFESSAKDGTGVNEIFDFAARLSLKGRTKSDKSCKML